MSGVMELLGESVFFGGGGFASVFTGRSSSLRRRIAVIYAACLLGVLSACGVSPVPVAPVSGISPRFNLGSDIGAPVDIYGGEGVAGYDAAGQVDGASADGNGGDSGSLDASATDALNADALAGDTVALDAGSSCVPTQPPVEKCDGVDNDCDGETDEQSCSVGNPCTVGVCDSEKARNGGDGCLWSQPAGLPCEDGDKCTGPDLCKGGACIAGSPLACDDGNTCTLDECDPVSGACVYKVFPNGIQCNDGKPCTQLDKCAAGECVGEMTPVCEDGEVCTMDDCDSTGNCLHVPVAVGACSDGDACTKGDLCGGGKCQPGQAVDCADDNGCTVDSCEPVGGCQHVAKKSGIGCSDGICKKGGMCNVKGVCEGEVDLCDDQDPCTVDTCLTAMGCQHSPESENAICGPGSVCKTGAQIVTQAKGKGNLPIPDYDPIGVNDAIVFPDKGLADSIAVHVTLENSDISGLTIELFDPNNAKYVLYDKGSLGKTLDRTWPTLNQPVSGNLLSWIGKNPKGKWQLVVYDLKFLNGAQDGNILSWSIQTSAKSNKMLCVKP